MQRLEFLMRRFRQLVPQPLRRLDRVQARSVRCWLVDDVGPVLEDFVQRPRFRVQATWPLQTLGVGARTAERALVEQVDAALVDAGRILRQWARRPHLRQQVQAVAVKQVVTEETVLIEAGRATVTSRTEAAVNRLPALLSQLDHISGRFWQDLVCREDYFAPTGGWMECQRTPVQSGEWVVALNPELHPGGDFISRCLCRRVEVLTEILGDFGRLCAQAFRRGGARPPAGWEAAVQRTQALTALAGQLRQACLGGSQQPLRDACILLTQAHAALHPQADLGWLGLPEAIVHHGPVSMSHRLLRNFDGELLERLAVSLGELPGLYAGAEMAQSALEEAIAQGGLVLVRSSARVYWQGEAIPVIWTHYPVLWRFLRALVTKGRRGAAVEARDLYERPVAASTLGTVLMRFKKLVPASLWRHVVPSQDPRGYRLDLERQRLHLF